MHRWLPPPVAFLMGIMMLWLVVRLPPELSFWALEFDFPGRRAVGIAFFSVGLGLMLFAVREMQRVRTTVNPLTPERCAVLVTSGVFRLTRNPIYLGDALVLIGAMFWFGSMWGLVVTGAFVAYVNFVQIRVEEKALRHLFGDDFDEFCARTPRWFIR
ncbi:MAG: methyltransferase family protein [Thioalkalivibrionaceae bacterium]